MSGAIGMVRWMNQLLSRRALLAAVAATSVPDIELLPKSVNAGDRGLHWSDAGVHFENSNQNVRLMFVLGTPKSNPGDYLMLVGSLCRLIKEASQREALFAAATPEAFIATVKELEDKVFGPAK